jgi:Fe-S-cluster-containing hydrogenase component 2
VHVTETKADGGERELDYLGPGRHFGEIGLISALLPQIAVEFPFLATGLRTATCTALDHVEVVRIDRDTFKALLETAPEIRKELEKALRELMEKNRRTRGEIGHLLGPFTQQGLYQGQNLLVLDLKRCTRCQECVKGCADSHGGVTRLILEGNRFDNYLVPSACRSCHDPACLIGCPVDAIHRRPLDPRRPARQSMAIVIEDHCIGCSLCSYNCPFGSIHMYEPPAEDGNRRAAVRRATNCDLCESLDGNPRCVYVCPHDAAHRMKGVELAHEVGLAPLDRAEGPGPH